MKYVKLGESGLTVPAVAVGCMRLSRLSLKEMQSFLCFAVENSANFFDHADIYSEGASESLFGEAMSAEWSIRREDVILQSKCGIRKGFYDLSAGHIVRSAEESLSRLKTDYLDILLLHRPDALVEPEEVAEAFERLYTSGKVLHFGVSNHRPMQIELLKKTVRQPLIADQLQFSLPVSNIVAGGLEVNMDTPGAADRDGSVLDYCRLHGITVQAWSPFQKANWQGCFLGSGDLPALNSLLGSLAEQYGVSETAIAAAWIFRHPAGIQLISGTADKARLLQIIQAGEIILTREEWYRLYLAAGHILP